MDSNDRMLVEANRFVEDRELRDAFADRIDVLSKVKVLMLIPELQMVTARQIAEFYEVELNTLKQCIQRNKKEIALDGVKTLTAKEFQRVHGVHAKETAGRGRMIVTLSDGRDLQINPNMTAYFSIRAMLRIGMLLTKSTVAQEVRTHLLNTQAHATQTQRTYEIDEETVLLLDIIKAPTDAERAKRMSLYMQYTQRHAQRVAELELVTQKLVEEKSALQRTNNVLIQENHAYSGGAMTWDARAIVERLIKAYAAKAYKNCLFPRQLKFAWNKFYSELYYDHRISLASRRKANGREGGYLDYVRPDEWQILVSKAFAMCRRIGCEVEQVLQNDVVYEQILSAVHAEDAASKCTYTRADGRAALCLPEGVLQ